MPQHTTDVVIIGAGIAGACVARELMRYRADVVVLDASLDIASGASRANSGIVHAGYDPMPGTLKARYNVEGARLYPAWATDLGFGYWPNGSMVVAFDESEAAFLEELLKRGRNNGVEGLEIVSGSVAREMEPNLSVDAVAALVAPSGAICDPYGMVYGALENAIDNGAHLVLDSRVVGIDRIEGGYRVLTRSSQGVDSSFETRTIVNAAGVHADTINDMVSDVQFAIKPRRGDYCLYDNRYGHTFTHTMFQTPSQAGKGVLVTPTIHGNLLVGPSAIEQLAKEDVATTDEGLSIILERVKKTWPDASKTGVICTFAGIRSTGGEGDFVIGEAVDAPGFFNVACFDSPGLTAAPAVGVEIAQGVAAYLGAPENAAFNPKRVPATLLAMSSPETRHEMIAKDESYARVVCRCCDVTEGELLEAMRRSIPVLTFDALKWRTGATMGPCHGGACEARIVALMAQELGVSPHQVLKRHPGSYVLAGEGGDVDVSEAPANAAEGARVSSSFDFATSSCMNGSSELAYDLVVVGGGVAGMAAALQARNAGVDSVLVIDRDVKLGGWVGRLTNPSFGIVRFGAMMPGVEFVRREREAFDANPADVLTGAQVLSVAPAASPEEPHVVTFAAAQGVGTARARAVVLACGGREHSAGELVLAGGRPAGVFTAGSASAYANDLDCNIGTTAVVYGVDSGAAMAAAGLQERGLRAQGIYLDAPDASVLKPGVEGFLKAIGLELHFGSTLVALEGSTRLEGVWMHAAQTEEKTYIPCDTLVVSIDSAPETVLLEKTGAQFDPETRGVVTDEDLSIGIPGIFACGNARLIHDGADFATLDGERAGRNAAAYLLGTAK